MIEPVHDSEEQKCEPRRGFWSYVWGIGLALGLALAAIRLIRALLGPRRDGNVSGGLWGEADTIEPIHDGEEQEQEQEQEKQEYRREFWSYVWGFALALVLTLVPFALVYQAAIPRFPLLIVIGAFALVQMLVHFRFFLHIGFRQKREDLQLILFSALLLLFIMVAGTIWIMASLATRTSLPLPA